jgi:hypothetical protein
MYYTDLKTPNGMVMAGIHTHLDNTGKLFQANVNVGGAYNCCEGQIVARLFDTNPPTIVASALNLPTPHVHVPLFPKVIGHLINQANNQNPGVINITDAHIVIVVLHIHSRQDPCARCSEVLSGLSRQMNLLSHGVVGPPAYNKQTLPMTNLLNGVLYVGRGRLGIPNFAAAPGFIAGGEMPGIVNLVANLRNGNAKFLVELSSNGPYAFGIGGGQQCSCTEIAGQNGNIGVPTNIVVGGGNPAAQLPPGPAAGNLLAIPRNLFGAAAKWRFNQTFPPYVIYSLKPLHKNISYKSLFTRINFF